MDRSVFMVNPHLVRPPPNAAQQQQRQQRKQQKKRNMSDDSSVSSSSSSSSSSDDGGSRSRSARHYKRLFSHKEMKFELCMWKDLPPKVKKALKKIGYEKWSWDEGEYVDIDYYPWGQIDKDTRQHLKVIGWTSPDWNHKWRKKDWTELPQKARKAAKMCGWNKNNWETYDGPDEWWEDLNYQHKQSLCVLGWTRESWDNHW